MGICVEVPCLEDETFWQNPEVLIEAIKRDLLQTRQITGLRDIHAVHIEKVADSYPIYGLGYQNKLFDLRKRLNRFENLILLGRSGTFWYNNMDHSIKTAMEAAREIINNGNG